MFRFIHAADIHLGYRQYGSVVRYNDYARMFDAIASDAIARRANLLLLAGDVLHKHSIDPQTLLQATLVLRRLQDAGITVIAVQGNHERPQREEATSWLGYLAELGLLKLLATRYREGHIVVEPWSEERMEGTYIDLPCGVRVLGVQYYGAATARVVHDLAEALTHLGPRPPYTILMLHAGLQGILDNYTATLSRSQLEQLRPHVDYLALGHIHKPFSEGGWIYNPGSPETTSIVEVEWEDRGYLVVDVDNTRSPAHEVTPVSTLPLRRPFVRLSFKVDTYSDPQALYDALDLFLAREAGSPSRTEEPVVEVGLQGVLTFAHSDLDIAYIEDRVREIFGTTVCRVKDSTVPNEFDIALSEGLTRGELERLVLRELVERDARHQARSETWCEMIMRLKEMALAGDSAQNIVAELNEYARALEESAPEKATDAVGESSADYLCPSEEL